MPQEKNKSIASWFGENLAELLSEKICGVFPSFDQDEYKAALRKNTTAATYTQLVDLHATMLHMLLPSKYPDAITVLRQILGEENPNETGMFTFFYWLMPVAKYVEKYGLDHPDLSLTFLEELTKRSTAEYAVRPFIRRYPEKMVQKMTEWSVSPNFHLRRLASEGLRPKLPWATKLDLYIENPGSVFIILRNLMQDEIKFVQKSVANNIRDYLKVNQEAAIRFMSEYNDSDNKNTQWILKHATRKMSIVA